MSLRLVAVELRRFWARRAIVGALLAVLLLALVVNVVQLARSKSQVLYVRESIPQDLIEPGCIHGTHFGSPVVGAPCFASSGGLPSVSIGPSGNTPFSKVNVYIASGSDRRIAVGRTFSETVRGVGLALTLLVAFLAATFIAADFGTSIGTQLLFEPRRRRVYISKTVAVAVACFLLATVVLLWCGALQYAGSTLRGTTDGIDGTWFVHRAGDIARVSGASAMMAAVAFAIGAFTRRTAGAIGVLFGLLIAMQFLRARPWTRAIGRVVPVNAIWAVAIGRFEHRDEFLGLHTMGGAVVIGLAWVATTMLLGAAWFARREIR